MLRLQLVLTVGVLCALCCAVAKASEVEFADLNRLPAPVNEPLLGDDSDDVDSLRQETATIQASYSRPSASSAIRAGYDSGFVIASNCERNICDDDLPFLLRMNGWGQLRMTNLNSQGPNPDLNQFQLKRGRLVLSGHAFTSDFAYYVQFDGRSSSGDDVRLLDYYLTYDIGHHSLGFEREAVWFKAGKYKMPFTMARYLSGREFEFADRSVASTFFDVNRSLGCGLQGQQAHTEIPWSWEVALFNGFVTGGAETGSSGSLDNNFAYSGRLFFYPVGEWGPGQLADFQWHETLALRTGFGFAGTTIDREGLTEFQSIRVVDTGQTLASLLPGAVNRYSASSYAVDVSAKWHGWSSTFEYYLRSINEFDAPVVPSLFDHGFWLQIGKFVVPERVELLWRWSRVVGDSGTLGAMGQSSGEVATGLVWYFRGQHAKLTFDLTHLDGAPISSSSLDIQPGEEGWLFRSQLQFAF